MSEFIRRRVETYIERIRTEATVPYGGGKVQLDPAVVRDILRDEPREVTELVIRTQLTGHQQGAPDRLQLALLLATLYQEEFDDGRMIELVRNTAGGEAIPWGMSTPDSGNQEEETRLGPPLAFRVLSIEDDDPREGDIRHILRIFGDLERRPSQARVLRGLVTLSFPRYEDDPRPNFAIPGVRACAAVLDARFPYFLYYIVPQARVTQALSYMNSLLPLEQFDFLPGTWSYTGTTKDLIDLLIPRVAAVRRFCEMTGEDPDEVTGAVLQSYPKSLANAIGTAFRSADGP